MSTKVHIVKAKVFPVVMYGCVSWTMKKAESPRIDTFKLGCWRRLLRVPWTARRSNQTILKEIKPKYSLEGLKLKLQYLEGQGSLACCSPWGCKELDATEQLNNKSIHWVAGILESSIMVSKMRELKRFQILLRFPLPEA